MRRRCYLEVNFNRHMGVCHEVGRTSNSQVGLVTVATHMAYSQGIPCLDWVLVHFGSIRAILVVESVEVGTATSHGSQVLSTTWMPTWQSYDNTFWRWGLARVLEIRSSFFSMSKCRMSKFFASSERLAAIFKKKKKNCFSLQKPET